MVLIRYGHSSPLLICAKKRRPKADNTICTVQYIDNDTDTPYSHRPWCLQLLVLMGGMDGDGDGASYTGAGIVFVRVYWGKTSHLKSE